MTSIIPYLVFSGNCKEAMKFYAEILGGEITVMQTFGDSPIDVPVEFQGRIFNSELRATDLRLKASDDLPNHPVSVGSNISLFLLYSDKNVQTEVFNKLSEGGKVLFPIENSFGMLKDKYNIQWMIVHEGNQ